MKKFWPGIIVASLIITVIHFASADPNVPTGGGSGGGGSVMQGTTPWVDNITQWAGTAVGAATAWGTAPSGNVPGVNANVLSSVLPVGSANAAVAQASMSTTAAQIVAARTGATGTGRVAVTVAVPTTCGTLFVGSASGVTASTGFAVAPGYALTLNTTSALYGILASGSCTASEVETY